MAVFLSPVGGAAAQFFDNNGVILTGGKIYTYAAGTSTPQVTYTSSNGATAHSNPIILDASGRVPGGEIWLTENLSYKFLTKDANEVLIGTYDNLYGLSDVVLPIDSSMITYDPPFTGSEPTNVEARLAQTISVKDFGAVGDGSTNDAAAIQLAVTAADYGQTIYFPKGSYKVNSAINVPATNSTLSGVNFVGEGPSTRIIAGASGLNCIFNITGTNAKFTNLTIDANSTDVANGFFVNIGNVADIGSTIQECNIIGFPVGISGSGQNHYIENNFFLNNTRHIKFVDDGRNSSISGNYMLGGAIGIEFEKTGQQVEGTRIINNTILATAGNGAGIVLKAGLEIAILANIIDQTGVNSVGILINPTGGDSVSSIKITDNWIAAGQGSYGVFANGNNSNLYFNTNTFVSNNGLISLSAISLTDTNTYGIVNNRFLMTYSGATQDIDTSAAVNSTLLGNSSSLGSSNAILNKLNSQLNIATNLIVNGNAYSGSYNIGLTGPSLLGGTGNPNGSVTGVAGSIFMRSDGGVSGHIYVGQGGTVWTAITGV